jgi:hypothetical protein
MDPIAYDYTEVEQSCLMLATEAFLNRFGKGLEEYYKEDPDNFRNEAYDLLKTIENLAYKEDWEDPDNLKASYIILYTAMWTIASKKDAFYLVTNKEAQEKFPVLKRLNRYVNIVGR